MNKQTNRGRSAAASGNVDVEGLGLGLQRIFRKLKRGGAHRNAAPPQVLKTNASEYEFGALLRAPKPSNQTHHNWRLPIHYTGHCFEAYRESRNDEQRSEKNTGTGENLSRLRRRKLATWDDIFLIARCVNELTGIRCVSRRCPRTAT